MDDHGFSIPEPIPFGAGLRGRRVLVVDSDEATGRRARELLSPWDCAVECASTGDEALRLVKGNPYDAVLVDIQLPDMRGSECFLRLHESWPELPVILMTGFGYDPSVLLAPARKAGLKSVLYKPFRADQLIRELLRNGPPTLEKPAR